MGYNLDKLKDDTSLEEDLGADSLDTVELVMEFEDEFDISIFDEEFENVKTVGEIIAFLKGKGVKV